MKSNTELCEFVKSKVGCGYVWGTFGRVLTESLLKQKCSQYPTNVKCYENFIRENYLNRPTCDCVGLIKWFFWQKSDGSVDYAVNGMPDTAADGIYNLAKVKGAISSIPEKPGLAVFRTGHIGVYIGNGYVVEAKGTKYGVVKSKLADRNFTHWCEIPGISYTETPTQPSKPLLTSVYTVKSGDTMYEIAAEHGLTLSEIAKLNPQIKSLNLIHVGDRVFVSGIQKTAIRAGDKITVSGYGNSQSNGKGVSSKLFTNKKMIVICVKEGVKFPYACSTVLTAIGLGNTTAWFSDSNIS